MLSDRFDEAVTYARVLHADQTRKGTDIPYVAHLLAVTSLVLEAGGDEDEAIAALLHDGPEDQGGVATLDEIGRKFGERVKTIVAECSDTFEEPKPPWRDRKVRYVEHLGQAGRSTLLVSCADKLHNARSILVDYQRIGDELWERFRGGRDGTLWYYRSLVDRYRELGAPAALVEPLAATVAQLEEAANTQ